MEEMLLEECFEDIFFESALLEAEENTASHSLNYMYMKRHQQVQSLLQTLHHMQVAVAVAVVREHNTL